MYARLVARDIWICARCANRAKNAGPLSQHGKPKRGLSTSIGISERWQERASQIKAGSRKSMLNILEERGLLHQTAGERKELEDLMTDKRIGAYCGVDPTAPSLHVGHLLPLMSLFWLYLHGYPSVMVLGGATSKIGDPSGRLTSREDQQTSQRIANMDAMYAQMKALWLNVEAYAKRYGYDKDDIRQRVLVNNSTWMEKLNLMDFLQVIGPGTRMGAMMAKDTVKNKMKNGDGMSFAEFTYPLLQAWDWWHMYDNMGVQLQIGGADQYGNITAGIDAVKYIKDNHPDLSTRQKHTSTDSIPMGFTVPLLTTSSGQKFGKSAGNAIWLDNSMTSAFDLYGYFMKTSDADVGRYLRLFTFMPIPEIEALMVEHTNVPKERKAQRKLAFEFLSLVHGTEEAERAERAHTSLFARSSAASTSAGVVSALNLQPESTISRDALLTSSLASILKTVGFAKSNSEAHRMISSGSIYIGTSTPSDAESSITYVPVTSSLSGAELSERAHATDNLLLLRRGKSHLKVIKIEDVV